jgi:hypothetical protein
LAGSGRVRRKSATMATGSSTMPAAIARLATRARAGTFAETTTRPRTSPAPNSSSADLL